MAETKQDSKAGASKAGASWSIMDLLKLAENFNLILSLVSSCYDKALKIAALLGTAVPKSALPKSGVKLSVQGFIAMLRALDIVLTKVLELLGSPDAQAKFGAKKGKK